jgi:hypothetical protein
MRINAGSVISSSSHEAQRSWVLQPGEGGGKRYTGLTGETCSIITDLSVSDVKSPYLRGSESLWRASHTFRTFFTNHDP